jgi:hypothetical protein
MSADDFFNRWAKRKADSPPDAPSALKPAPASSTDALRAGENPAGTQSKSLPTLADVDNLTRDSDYSPFVAKGVDEAVKRSAMKKLFSDPHFNIMDGLDIYIGDYNKFEPIPPEMLAALNHAKALLDPLSQFEKPLMRLVETVNSPEEKAAINSRRMEGEEPSTEASETDPGASTGVSTIDEKLVGSFDLPETAAAAPESDIAPNAVVNPNNPAQAHQ